MNDHWESLLAGRLERLCHEPDGRTRFVGPPPAALLSGSFDPLHAGHLELAECAARHLGLPVAFELSVVNADKPVLGKTQLEVRARQFIDQSPLWLTREPTFAGKARLFPGTAFVLGIDTAVRVLDPKYYGGMAGRDAAMRELVERGCRFVVAGRLAGSRFVPAGDLDVPAEFTQLFEFLTDFRVDLSSTQLRGGDAS